MICVLDASALLAAYQRERGWERVERDLDEACIGTVNLSEATAKLVERGRPVDDMRSYIMPTALTVVPFEVVDAYVAAALRRQTRTLGLSFADRACLALARRLGLPALTTDRAWAKLDLGVTVEVIR